ncbi:Phosphatase NudJ [Thalassocella blandensis]|nr:Phosphatase NudJ [Thalassocella blandensis]
MHPHVTVATVIEKDNKFLMVKERAAGEIVINQPAGHMELQETLLEAAIRETKEETTWDVELTGYLGVSQFTAPANGVLYIRHSFVANAIARDESAQLDSDILEATWMTLEEIQHHPLRSKMVLNDIQRYLAGKIVDLDMFTNIES